MASHPQPANHKRKRGRPSNASRNAEDASSSFSSSKPQQRTLTRAGRLTETTRNAEESDMPRDARPRKRGRTAQPEPNPEPEQNEEQTQAQQTTGVNEENTTQPKKRGRPANKSTRQGKYTPAPAADEADDEDDDEGNSSLLRRSGRERKPMGEWYKSPSRTKLDRAPADIEGSREESSPRTAKRNKQRAGVDKRKGGRAVNGTQDDETEQETAPQPPKRRPGRPTASSQVTSEAEGEADVEAEEVSALRGRKKRGPPPSENSPTTDNQKSNARLKQKRAHSSLQQVQNVDEQEDGSQEAPRESKTRGRPSQLSNGDVVEASSSQRSAKSRRGRPTREQEDTTQEHEPEASKPGPDTQRKRKRPPTPSASPEPEPEPERPAYQHLATRTRRVPWGIIESKWEPLDAASISSVTDLLASASRPVLLRLNNPARRAQAAAALGAISNRLRSKLSRGLPFPPPLADSGTGSSSKDKGAKGGKPRRPRTRPRDDELEYDRTVAGIRGLEAALDPLLHSVELLRRERDRAQRELEREYRVLATLGTNARAQARERHSRGRRLHVLAAAAADGGDHHEDEDDREEDEQDASFSLREGEDAVQRGTGNLFAEILDLEEKSGEGDEAAGGKEELTALAAQIAGHMETMRGNLAQIDGVVPALAGGRAALTHVLAGRLGADRLEDVLLGDDG